MNKSLQSAVKEVTENYQKEQKKVFVISQFPSNTIKNKIAKKRRQYKLLDEELLHALKEDNVNQLEQLYRLGYNIYANDDELLSLAVKNKNYRFCEYLLQNGANPNCQNNICFSLAKNHGQLLHLLEKYDTYYNGFNHSYSNCKVLKL